MERHEGTPQSGDQTTRWVGTGLSSEGLSGVCVGARKAVRWERRLPDGSPERFYSGNTPRNGLTRRPAATLRGVMVEGGFVPMSFADSFVSTRSRAPRAGNPLRLSSNQALAPCVFALVAAASTGLSLRRS